jgi:hypothetical protein
VGDLLGAEAEHEVGREPRSVALDGLDQHFGFDAVQLSQVVAEQNALPAQLDDSLRRFETFPHAVTLPAGADITLW